MNENNLTQTATEQEDKAVDALIRILLLFIVVMVAFSAGYCHAANEAASMVKTILN